MPPVTDRSALAAKLLASIDRHGRVTTWQQPPEPASATQDDEREDAEDDEEEGVVDPEELQNYVPGQVLLALAAAQRTGIVSVDEKQLERAFRYYRHRFRYKRDFGQVSWMALAGAAWTRLTSKREGAGLVFEIVDWILEFQHSQSGAFLTDHQPDTPGYTTAVYLEAIAAAIHVAAEFKPALCRRYDDAWCRGVAFLDRLIIQDRDSSVLPNADYAVGGLRENLYSGHIRIDFVQHSLAAMLERYPNLLAHTNPTGESEWLRNARDQDRS